jgi:hypothetical protein
VRKRDELSNQTSCINRALDHELTFVLLGRDAAAPYAIRRWAAERISSGKNTYDDRQIKEALDTAEAMDRERVNIRYAIKVANERT